MNIRGIARGLFGGRTDEPSAVADEAPQSVGWRMAKPSPPPPPPTGNFGLMRLDEVAAIMNPGPPPFEIAKLAELTAAGALAGVQVRHEAGRRELAGAVEAHADASKAHDAARAQRQSLVDALREALAAEAEGIRSGGAVKPLTAAVERAKVALQSYDRVVEVFAQVDAEAEAEETAAREAYAAAELELARAELDHCRARQYVTAYDVKDAVAAARAPFDALDVEETGLLAKIRAMRPDFMDARRADPSAILSGYTPVEAAAPVEGPTRRVRILTGRLLLGSATHRRGEIVDLPEVLIATLPPGTVEDPDCAEHEAQAQVQQVADDEAARTALHLKRREQFAATKPTKANPEETER